MSETNDQLVSRLRSRLQRTTRRITWAEVAFGTAVAMGVVGTVWLSAAVLEATFWFGTTTRTALAGAIGTIAVGVIAVLLARPVGRLVGLFPQHSHEAVARKVGSHFPEVADRLVNLLHLAKGKRSYAPAPLVDEAIHSLAEDLDELQFEDVEDFDQARFAVRLASLPFVGMLAFLLLAPSAFFGASERLLAPNTQFTRPAPFELSVAPGSVRLVQGASLKITVRPSAATIDDIVLRRRDGPDVDPNEIRLASDSTGTFRHTISPVRSAFRYQIVAGPVQTDWFHVDVANRPLVRRLHVQVEPPRYTGLPVRELDPNVGDVSGLPGAVVHISADLDGPRVDTAELVMNGDPRTSLKVQDKTASGSFRLDREGTYHLRLETATGTRNRDPIRYEVSTQSDARPSVRFLHPAATTTLSDDLVQELRLQLSDDYGVSQAKLFYRLDVERFGDGEDSYSTVDLPLANPTQADQTLVHEWLLAQDTGLHPEPGDVIVYYVRAWDNDTINGPKSGRTAVQRLRRPSLSDQYEELDNTQHDAGEQMEQLKQRSDSVHQDVRQLREELRRTREADWQDRRQLQHIEKTQESVEQGAEKLSKQIEQMNRQMQKNGLSSSDLNEQFQELQRVIDEMKSPELEKALDDLRRAMENNNLREMQKAMEQVKRNEESYREQLERTISLFKQLKAQQKLEEMARRARELSDIEKELSKRTNARMEEAPRDSASAQGPTPENDENTSATNESSSGATQRDSTSEQSNPPSQSKTPLTENGANEDLASEQQKAAKKMKELQEELQNAKQEMKDVQSAPKERLQQLNEQVKQQNLPRQMQQNSQQLRQNELRDAQQGQRQMQKSLQNMQQKLSKMKSQMQGQQRQMNLAGLRTALENTLLLSKRQESLRTEVDDLAEEGPTLRSYAREQKTLADGLTAVADSLQSIAKRVPQITRKVQQTSGNALRAMETATTALDERNGKRATGHQKTSMMHLNQLALLLSDLLEKLQKQQGAGSGMSMQQMLQKLRQMSGEQQKLNKQIQQHLNNVQGERLTPEQSERRKELAKQQRRIKQELEEMNLGSEAREQVMGDLEKIMEQMDKSAEELEQERHSRALIKRQKQILTRLLNAQKSLRTQGKEPRRQGREATDEYDQRRPDTLPDPDASDNLRRDLIRALEMGYSPDYEELIRRYFDLLQNRESEPSDSQ